MVMLIWKQSLQILMSKISTCAYAKNYNHSFPTTVIMDVIYTYWKLFWTATDSVVPLFCFRCEFPIRQTPFAFSLPTADHNTFSSPVHTQQTITINCVRKQECLRTKPVRSLNFRLRCSDNYFDTVSFFVKSCNALISNISKDLLFTLDCRYQFTITVINSYNEDRLLQFT